MLSKEIFNKENTIFKGLEKFNKDNLSLDEAIEAWYKLRDNYRRNNYQTEDSDEDIEEFITSSILPSIDKHLLSIVEKYTPTANDIETCTAGDVLGIQLFSTADAICVFLACDPFEVLCSDESSDISNNLYLFEDINNYFNRVDELIEYIHKNVKGIKKFTRNLNLDDCDYLEISNNFNLDEFSDILNII